MIAKVFPDLYDFDGKRIPQPSKKRHPSFKGRPMGLFGAQPLNIICRDLDEIRAFLRTCRYVSDQKQFGLKDHWMPPAQFEEVKQGDCDDFALWAWRQLLNLGYNARFVVGKAGRYGEGHAWVAFRNADGVFIVEPLAARYRTFARLEALSYHPAISVEFTDSQVKYFDHPKRTQEAPFRVVAPQVPEWVLFRVRVYSRLILMPYYLFKRYVRKRNPS